AELPWDAIIFMARFSSFCDVSPAGFPKDLQARGDAMPAILQRPANSGCDGLERLCERRLCTVKIKERKSIQAMQKKPNWASKYPLLRKYLPLVHEDLSATYTRDLHKWLLIAPIIGVVTGLAVTGIAVVILQKLWPKMLTYYLHHHWAIVPGVLAGFIATGLIMQLLTPDPNEHSTEEVVRSYHSHQGDIDMRPFFYKLLAAVTTVGFGGSAALEGPSIYGGGAIGSWLWAKLRRFRLERSDRRIMLISGAAAGMAAVF